MDLPRTQGARGAGPDHSLWGFQRGRGSAPATVQYAGTRCGATLRFIFSKHSAGSLSPEGHPSLRRCGTASRLRRTILTRESEPGPWAAKVHPREHRASPIGGPRYLTPRESLFDADRFSPFPCGAPFPSPESSQTRRRVATNAYPLTSLGTRNTAYIRHLRDVFPIALVFGNAFGNKHIEDLPHEFAICSHVPIIFG